MCFRARYLRYLYINVKPFFPFVYEVTGEIAHQRKDFQTEVTNQVLTRHHTQKIP